jgi:hypothetical protein
MTKILFLISIGVIFFMIFQSAAMLCLRPRQDFSIGTARINGRPQDFRRRMWFLQDLVPAHFSRAESCVSCAKNWARCFVAHSNLFPLSSSSLAGHLTFPLRDISVTSMWSAQGPNSRWLWQMPGILKRMFQSVACLCGLYKEIGVTLNSSCTARDSAAIPDRHLSSLSACSWNLIRYLRVRSAVTRKTRSCPWRKCTVRSHVTCDWTHRLRAYPKHLSDSSAQLYI